MANNTMYCRVENNIIKEFFFSRKDFGVGTNSPEETCIALGYYPINDNVPTITKYQRITGTEYVVGTNVVDKNYIVQDIPLIELIQAKVDDFGTNTQLHIFSPYSAVKQASDANDKEYWGAWLISHFPTVHTSDNIYSKMFASANNIFNGTSTLQDEVTALQEVTSFVDADEEAKYPIALEQLLKVAIRQGWVQACKAEYSIKTAQVNSATTIDELEAVALNLPGYPL